MRPLEQRPAFQQWLQQIWHHQDAQIESLVGRPAALIDTGLIKQAPLWQRFPIAISVAVALIKHLFGGSSDASLRALIIGPLGIPGERKKTALYRP
ncbi:hypothetical protein [Candidatus Accumulibacter sp. ACC003]|uniref:hypothetical protein n=1 Tax=Candidatus Accumulibacter sp. ACC003 TaxID=2823334 RepID=UPI0025C469F1|nr:hypothetical protein [Candidatus Accumulibacter sp. ACC003]